MVISMLSASNTVLRQFVGCTPARMSLDGGQFTFLGQSVTLTERHQIVTIHGPWMAEKGRHSFRRGFVKLPDGITEHDETAAHMLMRIEKSAAKAEVCASPTLGLASALSGHHDLSTTILVCAQEQRVKFTNRWQRWMLSLISTEEPAGNHHQRVLQWVPRLVH